MAGCIFAGSFALKVKCTIKNLYTWTDSRMDKFSLMLLLHQIVISIDGKRFPLNEIFGGEIITETTIYLLINS